MVLNTFRRAARKQLQQEAAGKSCLESPQGQFGNSMVHERLRRRLVMNFFSWLPLAWARAAIMSAQKGERKLNAPPIGIHWALIGKLFH